MKPVSRRCSNCKKKVDTDVAIISSLKAFCTYECLKTFTAKNAEKIADKNRKDKRQEDRKRKEKLKTKGQWTKEVRGELRQDIRKKERCR